MTNEIKKFIESHGLLICPQCEGEGEVGYFCGHDSTQNCSACGGKGIIKSLNKQLHRKTCVVCRGRGGIGCCDERGYQEWESFEIYKHF
jgi:DnaJ-class molecular chaperone